MARRKAKKRSSGRGGVKYRVVCGSRTKSRHRLKRAANKAKPSGCRVVKGGGTTTRKRRRRARR